MRITLGAYSITSISLYATRCIRVHEPHMFMSAIGALLVLLGLFSGAVLVLAPLGFAAWPDGLTLWVLFPVFSLLGYSAFVIGAKTAHVRGMSIAVCALLLVLAAASAVALVLTAASILNPVGSTFPLWYVLAIAGAVGGLGAAAHQAGAGEPEKST